MYKEIWRAATGEVLVCTSEPSNMVDKYAIVDSYLTLAMKDLKSVLYISKQRRLDMPYYFWKLILFSRSIGTSRWSQSIIKKLTVK